MTAATAEPAAALGQRAAAPLRPLVLGLVMVALAVGLTLSYGFAYRFVGDLVAYYQACAAVFVGIVLFAVTVLVAPVTNRTVALTERWVAWGGCLCTWFAFALTCFFYGEALRPLSAPIAIGGALMLAAAAQARFGGAAGARLIAVMAFTLFAHFVATQPIDVNAANMLPLIAAGASDFVQGINPYRQSYPEIAAILPFHYLPGLWLPYAGAVAAGMEMRLVSLACLAILYGLFELIAVRRGGVVLLGLAVYPLMVSPPVAQMIVHGHVWPYWVLTVSTVALIGTRRFLPAAIALGLLLTARQLAVFLVAPIAVYMIRQLGFLPALRYGLVALATYLAVVLPFVLWTPGFFAEMYLSVADQGTVHAEIGNPLDQVALSSWFYTAEAADLLKPIQAALMLGAMAYLFANGRLDLPRLLAIVGLAYLLAVTLNPFLYRYHYVPGLLTLAVGAILGWSAATRRPVAHGAG